MNSRHRAQPRAHSRRNFLLLSGALPLLGIGAVTMRQLSDDRRSAPTPSAPRLSTPTTPAATTTVASPSTMARPTPNIERIIATHEATTPSQWGLDLPGCVSHIPGSTSRTIALTFDACGGPHGSAIDESLLATLREHRVPATLFFNQRWVDANLEAAKKLAEDPLFQIENHGTVHLPLSVRGQAAYGIAGTASARDVVQEIEGNRARLRNALGVESNWFRSGTAHYDDVAIRIAHDLGVSIAGFATNGDFGATATATTVSSQLLGASPSAIAIMHMNQPRSGTAAGVAAAIPQLKAAGFEFVKLGPAPRS
ncbi:polysaccharide deacetylase family protein [Staphylococcus chromogenes]|nr:polysaccharide deacetylase family protein [Staphylococcus chromogenes]